MNLLTRFAFDSQIAHGAIVQASQGVPEMLRHRRYSADVTALIGEAMAAMPLLATHMNFEGRINLQFRGEGAMKLLVAQVDHHLHVRGMATAPDDHEGTFEQLLYGGLLALMIEPVGGHRAASQAIVLIRGQRLEQALEGYFAQSEQLPTLVRLACDGTRIAGFLLQMMPLQHARVDEDEWRRLYLLAETLTPAELLGTEPLTLLRRLYAEDVEANALRVFEPQPVSVQCRCNREGIGRMILSLGRAEADSILAEQGQVKVTCEFCGNAYTFTPGDVEQLFSAVPPASSQLRH